MSKMIPLASSKKTIYNGTHGNASFTIGHSEVTASAGDSVKLAVLDVGVQLVNATIHNAAFGTGVKGTVYCVPKGEAVADKYKVTGEIDLSSSKATNSDDNGWFPTQLEDVKRDVIMVITGDNVAGKKLSYRITTTSIGNL